MAVEVSMSNSHTFWWIHMWIKSLKCPYFFTVEGVWQLQDCLICRCGLISLSPKTEGRYFKCSSCLPKYVVVYYFHMWKTNFMEGSFLVLRICNSVRWVTYTLKLLFISIVDISYKLVSSESPFSCNFRRSVFSFIMFHWQESYMDLFFHIILSMKTKISVGLSSEHLFLWTPVSKYSFLIIIVNH
jgi:hypothetical protein